MRVLGTWVGQYHSKYIHVVLDVSGAPRQWKRLCDDKLFRFDRDEWRGLGKAPCPKCEARLNKLLEEEAE